MGSIKKGELYAEQVETYDDNQCMKDDVFLLMQQCIRDARQLQTMTQHFDNNDDGPYLESWENYETNLITLAKSLFDARINKPMNLADMKQLLMAADSSLQDKKECLQVNQELTEVVEQLNVKYKELSNTDVEIEKAKKTKINLRSQNFLLSVIGSENVKSLNQNGFLDVKGTNEATYRIHQNGEIDSFKITRDWRGNTKQELRWHGKIRTPIMNDGIATVYMHIHQNSDKFDIDKKCGSITIET